MPPRALHIDASAPHHRESDTAAPAPGTATKAVDNEYTGYTEPYDRSPTDTAYLPPPSPRGMPATAVNSFDSKTEVGRSEYEDKTSAARQVDNLSDIESQPPTPSSALPPGCKYGTLPREDGTVERVIWVDFPAGSRENPFYFSRSRKLGITLVATFFTFMTAYTTSAYSISAKSMCAELGCTTLQIEAGIALYCWGFGIAPLALAPISEELGRKWTYIAAVIVFFLLQLMMTLGKNTATILVSRFILGTAGSIGATLVGGTISDIFVPSKRGLPMALFGFCAIFGTGFGGTTMAFTDVDLGWRWVNWIQFIIMGGFCPIVFVIMRETRSTVLLRRKAAKLRKERGLSDGGARYIARSEIEKIKFSTAMIQSMSRPMIFLFTEPIVTFFALWIALGWGVFYIQIAGLPYTFSKLHGFNTIQVGQVYWTMCVGAIIGFGANFIQERVYRAQAPKRGVEARLYAPMVAGVCFAAGCFITGFTSIPSVHWFAPCVGLTLLLAAIMTIYVTAFTYLSECYGAYASSAIAAQSFLRNMMGGAFSFFTTAMFDTMTVRWAQVMMGAFAAVLALVPFVAFIYGPQIRARSKYSRLLMAQEREAIEKEREEREKQGMDTAEAEDLEGDANDETIERALSRTSHSLSLSRPQSRVPNGSEKV